MRLTPILSLLLLTLVGCGEPSGGSKPQAGTPDAGSAKSADTAKKPDAGKSIELLNVSYDPTRELWKDLNNAFAAHYAKENGTQVKIKQSHGASGSQARAVIDGLEADVVTLALWPDTDQLRKKGLIKEGWESKFANRSLPYTSTIVFVVRKGNPKGIKDWADLLKPGVEVITPSPKTSGNGKMAFLGAWGSVIKGGGTEAQATEFVKKLYDTKKVPVLDTGARGATTTFAQKGIGDVHLTWESEAYLEVKETGDLEIVYPPLSVLAEPHVAVVDKNVDAKGSRAVAEAYLNFAYTEAGQELIAKNYYRPSDAKILAKHKDKFPDIKVYPATDIVKSWDELQKKFFADGGVFDSIYQKSATASAGK